MFTAFRKYIEKVAKKRSHSEGELSEEKFSELRQAKASHIQMSLIFTTDFVDQLIEDKEFEEPLADPIVPPRLYCSTLIDILNKINSQEADYPGYQKLYKKHEHNFQKDIEVKNSDLIINLHYMISGHYVPPMPRDLWYEFYDLQMALITLYAYYSMPFDKKIAPFDMLIDELNMRLLYTLNQSYVLLRQKEFHLMRTGVSTKGHVTAKVKRKKMALKYYNQIKREDLSLWDKAEKTRVRWLRDTPREKRKQVPTQRTIYNYLKEEEKH